MSQEVILLCGIPGSGKSTYAKCQQHNNMVIVSRDEIRKSFTGENVSNQDYFNHEKTVFREFVKQINQAIEDGIEHIFVDATHISEVSRRKVLRELRPASYTALRVMNCNCDLETCLARNSERTGFAKVPESAIIRMNNDFEAPTIEEFTGYSFSQVSIEEAFIQ